MMNIASYPIEKLLECLYVCSSQKERIKNYTQKENKRERRVLQMALFTKRREWNA